MLSRLKSHGFCGLSLLFLHTKYKSTPYAQCLFFKLGSQRISKHGVSTRHPQAIWIRSYSKKQMKYNYDVNTSADKVHKHSMLEQLQFSMMKSEKNSFQLICIMHITYIPMDNISRQPLLRKERRFLTSISAQKQI